jgi:hypothetical protein
MDYQRQCRLFWNTVPAGTSMGTAIIVDATKQIFLSSLLYNIIIDNGTITGDVEAYL